MWRLYEVIVLGRAQRVLERLADSLDGEEIRDIVDSLEDDPYPADAYPANEEQNERYVYVGENRRWIVSYELDEESLTVYVHSIERRLSADLDPR